MASCSSPRRREFLLKGMTLAAALPAVLAIQTFSRSASAQAEPPDLDPKDAMAKAQGFTKNVDKAKPAPKERKHGSYCWNCLLYGQNPVPKGATADQTQKASCAVFAMKRVEHGDWCRSWAENAQMKGKKHA
jgi:hypothetical protein